MKGLKQKRSIGTHMSDLRPNCFCGRITCTEWDSLVFGIGWLIMAIALATLPTFLTCWNAERFLLRHGKFIVFCIKRQILGSIIEIFSRIHHLPQRSSKKERKWRGGSIKIITLLGKYEGSQTTFLHLAVSPSDVTPRTWPTSLNSTWHSKSNQNQHLTHNLIYTRIWQVQLQSVNTRYEAHVPYTQVCSTYMSHHKQH